jgi:polysaccharide deacetylase 2 family uncharacterized protein YibQ
MVVAALALSEYLQEGGGERLLAWLDRVSAEQVACSRIIDAVDLALVRLQVYDAELTAAPDATQGISQTTGPDDAPGIPQITARLPGTVPLAEANLEITSMVRAAGGRVIQAEEKRSRIDAPGTLTMSIGTARKTCCEVEVYENRSKVIPSKPAMLSLVVNTGDPGDLDLLSELLDLKSDVGIMVLPYRRNSAHASDIAAAGGADVLIGIPMEHVRSGEADPGEGSLLSSMTEDEVVAMTKTVLQSVPRSEGTVFFVESPLIHDTGKLRDIIKEIGRSDAFLIDASLTPYTETRSLCKREGVDFLTAVIHLNPGGKETVAEISESMQSLSRLSKRHGQAVGMCNLTPAFLVALERAASKLEGRDIKMVKPSSLLGSPGS